MIEVANTALKGIGNVATPSQSTPARQLDAGNLMLVAIRTAGLAVISQTVTDTAGNTYRNAVQTTAVDPPLYWFYAENCLAHPANQVTASVASGTNTFWYVYAIQLRGAATVGAIAQAASATQSAPAATTKSVPGLNVGSGQMILVHASDGARARRSGA